MSTGWANTLNQEFLGVVLILTPATQFQIILFPLLLSTLRIYFHSYSYTFIDISIKVSKFVEPVPIRSLETTMKCVPLDMKEIGLIIYVTLSCKGSYSVLRNGKEFIWQEMFSGIGEQGSFKAFRILSI